MVVWMMALSDTLLGPSACVAAITSSFEGFSLKMSLSESALFVSSGSLLVNFGVKKKKKDFTTVEQVLEGCKPPVSFSYHVEAVLLKCCAKYSRVRLHILQSGVVGCLHFYCRRHLHGLCNTLEKAQLDRTNVLQFPKNPHASGQQGPDFDI